MKINQDKIDRMTLALMYLVIQQDKNGVRAWKSFDWDTLDRLYAQGFISDPKSKAKSVVVTEKGLGKMTSLFEKLFLEESE